MTTETTLATATDTSPAEIARVVESLVVRGDISQLSTADRSQYYLRMCASLGLNPTTQPLAFLKLNGKEVLYATRGATDQLAAMHRLNREIIDGPRVIDLAGTKLVYAVCRATHPNGRVETAVATVPFVDPVNVLMKAETKCKRRATLSILGLGLLDEMEIETIAASARGESAPAALPAPAVPAAITAAITAAAPAAPAAPPAPAPIAAYRARIAAVTTPATLVAVALELAPSVRDHREAAWAALTARAAALTAPLTADQLGALIGETRTVSADPAHWRAAALFLEALDAATDAAAVKAARSAHGAAIATLPEAMRTLLFTAYTARRAALAPAAAPTEVAAALEEALRRAEDIPALDAVAERVEAAVRQGTVTADQARALVALHDQLCTAMEREPCAASEAA